MRCVKEINWYKIRIWPKIRNLTAICCINSIGKWTRVYIICILCIKTAQRVHTTRSLARSLSLTHPLTHSLTHSPTHSLIHSITQSPNHSLACFKMALISFPFVHQMTLSKLPGDICQNMFLSVFLILSRVLFPMTTNFNFFRKF